jgi:6-phosphogluconolactonase (cycloisomerase 2 family)
MFVYIGSKDNTLGVLQLDDESGCQIGTLNVMQVVDEPLLPSPPEGFFSRWSAKFTTPTTEWILLHPQMDLIYVFVGFMSLGESLVTTYHVDRTTGELSKMGVCPTGGLQVSYATFSPDRSLLVVCHHNDGQLSFFDCNKNGGVLEEPIRVIKTPEIRPETKCTDYPHCLPSLYHCQYTPDGKFLLTVDCSTQSRVWIYPVDEHGLVLSPSPTSHLKAKPIQSPPGALTSLVTTQIFQSPGRMRRVVFHPNGRYIYLLFESHSVIQVYEYANGRILADCLQEIPSIDPSFFDRTLPPWKQTMAGMATNMASELVAEEEGLWVSNRGLLPLRGVGRAENSVRCFDYQDQGARLVAKACADTRGPIRHFLLPPTNPGTTTLMSGTNNTDPGVIEIFTVTTNGGEIKKRGEIETGLDTLCLLALPEDVRHL